MKVAILGEFPSQPVFNIANSIKLHSNHQITLYDRFAKISSLDADVIYYINVLDMLLHQEAYGQIGSEYKICTSLRSYRALQDYEIKKRLYYTSNRFNILSCVNENMIKTLDDYKQPIMRIQDAPDALLFYKTQQVQKSGKMNVGYVGTFREDKKFNTILAPILKAYDQIFNPVIIGKAGKKIGIDGMREAYNHMDVLVCCSVYEGTPMPPLEAALCGRMSITSTCGVMKEVFDQSSATLIPYRGGESSIQAAFTEALLDVYTHRNDLKVKGDAAWNEVTQKLKWSDIVKGYDKMFEETFSDDNC